VEDAREGMKNVLNGLGRPAVVEPITVAFRPR
jgi:hypothetical protein